MRIRNANIYTEEHRFVRGDAAVENGRFVSCTGDPAGEEAVVDAEGMYLIPGLVDIHFHGCKGADMCDGTKEALDVITSYEASVGVTSVCPATMTIPKDELLEVMKNAGSYEYSGGSHLVGINMEGPFISPAKKGAQAAENIMHCDYEYFSQLQKAANGLIKLVDMAPEEPGAMEFIDRAKGEADRQSGETLCIQDFSAVSHPGVLDDGQVVPLHLEGHKDTGGTKDRSTGTRCDGDRSVYSAR